tara:strand:- start:82 stop:612 length:531 start_codon:yes stop_codon:yes gene_type:complete
MSYNPSESLKSFLNDTYIVSYRLVDGSYVIAEQVDAEEENNVMYVASPLQLMLSEKTQKSFLRPWIDCDEDELVTIAGDKIIGLSETPFALKLHYHRYLLFQRIHKVLSDDELEDALKEMFNDQVDNQDFMDDEGEDWKADSTTSESNDSLKEDFGLNQPLSDFHTEWRKKFRDNN